MCAHLTHDCVFHCIIMQLHLKRHIVIHSCLQLSITGVLDAHIPVSDHYYYEYAKFVPYQLDDAVVGTVLCDIVNASSDYNDLLPYIAAAASNTTVLAEGFADFYPTTAVVFFYENILTWKQVKIVL